MTWEDIIKEEEDKKFRLYMDKNAQAMHDFLKQLNDFTEDANDDYKGAYGNTPSTTVIKQLSSMLKEIKKLLKQKG